MAINYGSLYKTYKNKFYNAKRSMKEKHLPMVWDEEMNFDTFKGMFQTTRNTLQEKNHIEPSNTQVIKEMIDRQKFSGSETQGIALVKGMKAKGYDIDLATARAYQGYIKDIDAFNELPPALKRKATQVKAFYEDIDNFYHVKRAEGYSPEVIQQMISNIYFGSD